MDPVSAIGLAASLVSLVQAAQVLLAIITKNPQRLRQGGCGDPCGNARLRQQLEDTLRGFIHTLESAGSVSPGALNRTREELQGLETMLESLEGSACERCPSFMKCIWRCVRAPNVYAKLEEAERRLQSLRSEIVVIEGALILRNQLPKVFNERVEIPESDVCLDRSTNAMEFLQRSHQQDLRVIGIHGQAGLGKTTILNRIWEEASSKSPFGARAFVEIGLKPTAESLRRLQSSILEQLDGGSFIFPSDAHGREKLKEHFQKLRSNNKPLFLALDNVWEADCLKTLLPSEIWVHLSRFSCIALTSRDFAVVQALVRICRLQESDHLKVCSYSPPYLSPDDSKALFVRSASLSTCATQHEELLQALVPLCAGLPLALTTLGSIFIDEAKREEQQWRALVEQMDGPFIDPVMKALQISYEQLQPSHQAAFLDVVRFYYGWPWKRVERIVGKQVLQDLKNRSLISEPQHITRCNQSALKYGYDDASHQAGDYRFLVPKKKDKDVVAMHDLTLMFGGTLRCGESQIQSRSDDDVGHDLVSLEASKLRTLKLKFSSSITPRLLESVLENATNLKMLHLEYFNEEGRASYLEAGFEHQQQLRYLRPCQQLRYLRIDGMESVANLINIQLMVISAPLIANDASLNELHVRYSFHDWT